MSEIEKLKEELASLREDAKQADANLAFVLGIIVELAGRDIRFDPDSMLAASLNPTWSAALFERMSEGREVIKEARRHGSLSQAPD